MDQVNVGSIVISVFCLLIKSNRLWNGLRVSRFRLTGLKFWILEYQVSGSTKTVKTITRIVYLNPYKWMDMLD